jgi:hypothetical protein
MNGAAKWTKSLVGFEWHASEKACIGFDYLRRNKLSILNENGNRYSRIPSLEDI